MRQRLDRKWARTLLMAMAIVATCLSMSSAIAEKPNAGDATLSGIEPEGTKAELNFRNMVQPVPASAKFIDPD